MPEATKHFFIVKLLMTWRKVEEEQLGAVLVLNEMAVSEALICSSHMASKYNA